MGIENYVYAPLKGVHGKDPTKYVMDKIKALLDELEKNPGDPVMDRQRVIELLEELVQEAAEGFPNLK